MPGSAASSRSSVWPEPRPELSWIVGSSRSGNTWLMRMLCELGCAAVDDPHLGHHLSVWRPISLAHATSDGTPPVLETLPELRADNEHYFFNARYADVWLPHLRELILARFRAQHPEAERIVVKDPGMAGVADLLSSIFPDAGMIWLLRDGRDVVDSWLDGYGAEWGLGDGCYTLADSAASRAAFISWQSEVWAKRYRECDTMFERHPGPKVKLRYEELLDYPKLRLIDAVTALHWAEDVTLRDVGQAVDRHEFGSTPTGNGQRERSATPGSWRGNVTRGEEEIMLQRMGLELEVAGYL